MAERQAQAVDKDDDEKLRQVDGSDAKQQRRHSHMVESWLELLVGNGDEVSVMMAGG